MYHVGTFEIGERRHFAAFILLLNCPASSPSFSVVSSSFSVFSLYARALCQSFSHICPIDGGHRHGLGGCRGRSSGTEAGEAVRGNNLSANVVGG